MINNVDANSDYTLSYKLRLGNYKVTFKVNDVVVNEGVEYSSIYETYYHVFNTGSLTSIKFEVTIDASSLLTEGGTLTPWGHFGSLNISKGDNRPAEVVTTNYIRNANFAYEATSWTISGNNESVSYNSSWTGNSFIYDAYGKSVNTEEVNYSQELKVPTSGNYKMTSTITCGTGDYYDGSLFEYFKISLVDEAGEAVYENVDYKGSDLSEEGAKVEEIALDSSKTYKVVIKLKEKQDRDASTSPYGVVKNISLVSSSEDNGVTVDGYKEVKTGQSITLVSNRACSWSTESTAITLSASEDGKSCVVTGVSEATDVEVKATSKSSEAYFTHTLNVLNGYVVPEDTNIIKDASFDYSGRSGSISKYWNSYSESAPTIEFKAIDESVDLENREYYLNVWGAGDLSINQLFNVSEDGTYLFNLGTFEGSEGQTITILDLDSEATLYQFDSIRWNEAGKYSDYAYLELKATGNYGIQITYSGTDSSSYMKVDNISIEKTTIDALSVTSSLEGETYELKVGESFTLTTNVEAACESLDDTILQVEASEDKKSFVVTAVGEGNSSVKVSDTRHGLSSDVKWFDVNVAKAEIFTLGATKTSGYSGEVVSFTNKDIKSVVVKDKNGEEVSGLTITNTSFTFPEVTEATEYVVTATSESEETSSLTFKVYPSTIYSDDFTTDPFSVESPVWTKTENSEAGIWVWSDASTAESNGSILVKADGTSFANGATAYADLTFTIPVDATFSLEAYLNHWGDSNSISATLDILSSDSSKVIDTIWGGEWNTDHTANTTKEVTLTAGTYTLRFSGVAWQDGTSGCAILDNLSIKFKA